MNERQQAIGELIQKAAVMNSFPAQKLQQIDPANYEGYRGLLEVARGYYGGDMQTFIQNQLEDSVTIQTLNNPDIISMDLLNGMNKHFTNISKNLLLGRFKSPIDFMRQRELGKPITMREIENMELYYSIDDPEV